MSLNEEKIEKIEETKETEKIHHDNSSYCFENHTCINCKHKKALFSEEVCSICIGIRGHDKLCKWEH